MLTMIVGECGSGKSRYLRYLLHSDHNAYLLSNHDNPYIPVDAKLYDVIFSTDNNPLALMKDKTRARIYLTNMCRECSILLVDEIGMCILEYDDARMISDYLADIGRFKNVFAVTKDVVKLCAADRIVTVAWDGDIPTLTEISLDEAERIVVG